MFYGLNDFRKTVGVAVMLTKRLMGALAKVLLAAEDLADRLRKLLKLTNHQATLVFVRQPLKPGIIEADKRHPALHVQCQLFRRKGGQALILRLTGVEEQPDIG